MNFGTVAILGPGLIGGSLALALAERGLAKRLMIYARSPRALDEIRVAGVDAELTQNPAEAVREADVVILCVPIEAMPGLVHEFRDSLKRGALVTDVGSVKASVDLAVAPLLERRAQWIGSHPMAGSEQAGFSAARADLFEGATVIVTPNKNTPPEVEKRAEEFWAALGSKVVSLPADHHDKVIAAVSHMPHLIAAALVNLAVAHGDLDLAAGGFRDTTRVAAGSATLWTEILVANREAVCEQLDYFINDLNILKKAIKNGEKPASKSLLLAALKTAQDARSEFAAKKTKET